KIGLANTVQDRAHGRLQYQVSQNMAVAVIDVLEIVEIDHHQGEGFAVTLSPLPKFVESGVEMPSVVATGERVGDGPVEFFFGHLFGLQFIFLISSLRINQAAQDAAHEKEEADLKELMEMIGGGGLPFWRPSDSANRRR